MGQEFRQSTSWSRSRLTCGNGEEPVSGTPGPRFETPAGDQTQVDRGHPGSLSDGERERKLWSLTMTLVYSHGLMGQLSTGLEAEHLVAHA
jgi:hypothetical protein